MSEDLLQKCIEKWIKICPNAAQQVANLRCDRVVFCETEAGEANIKRVDNGEVAYHSNESAKDEAKAWFESLDLRSVGTLIVYGVGLGYYYEAAREWLAEDRNRTLIFLEDDLEVVHRLFETELGHELVYNRQVRLQYFQQAPDLHAKGSGLEAIPLYYFSGKAALSALGHYADKHAGYLPLLEKQIEFIKNCKRFLIMEYMNYGETFFKNFFQNMYRLPSSYQADKMFGKFKGMPAIICGAGPSLEKSLPLLEKLRERAVVFAGGSSLNVVSANGFLPHFGISIDPNWNQYARLFMNQAYEVPYFYRNRIFPQALALVQGEQIYVPGSGGYQLAEYFEKKVDIDAERVPEGANVINFSLSIAEAMGCNPIILVGVDLAYTDNRSYASGIVPHPVLDANKPIATRGAQEEVIVKSDIHGKPVNTLWKWLSESMWVTQFAVTKPRIKVINATAEGIGFEGVPNQSLEEVAESYLGHPFDYPLYIHGEVQNSPVPRAATTENITGAMHELKESFERCRDLCALLRKEFHGVLKIIRESGEAPENLITEKALKSLRELNKEPAYEYVLNNFNSSFMTFFGEIDMKEALEPEGEGQAQVNLSRRRVTVNKKRYEFLKVVCESSLEYINEAIDGEKLKGIISDAFEKQIAEAKKKAGEAKGVEDASIYERKEGKFRIEDEVLNLSFEETLEEVVSKETQDVQEYLEVKNSEDLNGCRRLLYPSGTLKMEQFYRSGKLHGPSSYYSEEGALLGTSWFVDGQKQGKSEYHYSNGAIHSIQRFVDGKRHGLQEYYYPRGQIKSLIEYKDGMLHGSVVLYYEDGFKKRETHFENGKRKGLEIVWNIGGIKEFEGVYRDDVPVGVFRSWYPFGNISRVVTYDEEGKLQDIQGWDFDGTPLPSDIALGKDYFDLVHDQANVLTDSLEGVYSEVESMTKSFSDKKVSNEAGVEFTDFADDLREVKKELENLKSINLEMGGKGSSSDTEEMWKNPEARRMVGEHIKEATQRISDDIRELEEVMRMTIQALADKRKKQEENDKDQ